MINWSIFGIGNVLSENSCSSVGGYLVGDDYPGGGSYSAGGGSASDGCSSSGALTTALKRLFDEVDPPKDSKSHSQMLFQWK